MAIQSTATTSTSVIVTEGASATMRSKVSENGAARIASMVVNMYADPISAVTREYIANAVDATIAAGSTKAVEVTVPTLLSPTLVIKDYGIGMDYETLENAFLAFAESTKGNTNDQVGGLGVGAKSAWTVCESFIVDTIKDGVRNVVRASRDLEHEVMIVNAASELPNGTVVTIPVNAESASWRTEVLKVAMFHKQGAVLVDGEPVKSVQSGKRLGPVRLGRIEGGVSNSRFTVLSGGTMFGVPSTLNDMISEVVTSGVSALIELPVGSFSHTPSREHLIADEVTRSALRAALGAYTKAHTAALKRITKLASTDVSAAISARAEYMNGERSRKILPLPYDIDVTGAHVYTATRRGSRASVWSHPRALRWTAYEIGALKRTVVVTGVPEGKTLKGIGRYMDTVHPTANLVVTIPEGQDSVPFKVTPPPSNTNSTSSIGTKTPGVTVVTYAEVVSKSKELSALAAATRAPAPAVLYHVAFVLDGEVRTAMCSLDDVEKVVSEATVSGGEVTVAYGDGSEYRTIHHISPSTRFLVIDNGRRSVNPIIARFPSAVNSRSLCESIASRIVQESTDFDIYRYLVGAGAYRASFAVRTAVAHAITSADGVSDGVREAIKTLARMSEVDISEKLPDHVVNAMGYRQWCTGSRIQSLIKSLDAEWNALCEMYPLLDSVTSSSSSYSGGKVTLDSAMVQHAANCVTMVAPLAQSPAI